MSNSENTNLQLTNVSKNSQRSAIIAGGVFVGLITALALGIIFGPLTAIIAFCIAGVSSSFAAKSQSDLEGTTDDVTKILQDTERLNRQINAKIALWDQA